MVPHRSEFSHGVWISIFLFYCLVLSFRSFTEFQYIVPMHVHMILLRNTKCRSCREIVAGVINQWFWCKYFAHNFILHSKCSEKILRLPILNWNTGMYPLLVPGAVCLCLGGEKRFCPFCHTSSQSDLFSTAHCLVNGHIARKNTATIWIEVCTTM